MRGMVRLAGDLGLTEEDMNLLYTKYERTHVFCYCYPFQILAVCMCTTIQLTCTNIVEVEEALIQ